MKPTPARHVRCTLGAAWLLGLVCFAHGAHADYLARTDVQSFIRSMHLAHGLELEELERVLGAARHQPAVVRLIGPTRTPQTRPVVRSYPAYRAKFLTRTRIEEGVRYWEMHAEDLRRAEARYGVPQEVILGILGVETAFGQNTGSFRVIDALATIAFDGPRRQDYFREELEHLLLLSREIGFDPLTLRGSYAGAMGLPQFMPSSYRRYAVDFDGDGKIDLVGSPSDAIGSIANYLRAHGWRAGEPASIAVQLPAKDATDLITGLERTHEVAALLERGVRFTGTTRMPQDLCSIVELPTPGKPSKYLAGFANFEAVTRYNRSTFYASTVLELAEAIRRARQRTLAAAEDGHSNASM